MKKKEEKTDPNSINRQSTIVNRQSSQGGFILIVVVTLTVLLALMASMFLRTARQSLRTVRQWETYDNSLWAAQSILDAQRYKMDQAFGGSMSGISNVLNYMDLTNLVMAITNGDYDIPERTFAELQGSNILHHFEDFPYKDKATVWVNVTATNSVDRTNEYLDVTFIASAEIPPIKRQFRETVRFKAERSIFHYAYFHDGKTVWANMRDMVVNGPIRANEGMIFDNVNQDDLVINGSIYAGYSIRVGTNVVDASELYQQLDKQAYANSTNNPGFGFARPLGEPTLTNGLYDPVASFSSNWKTNHFEFVGELRMPHIDLDWVSETKTGTLTNGTPPGRATWNGTRDAPFPNIKNQPLNYWSAGGLAWPVSGQSYWPDEVLVHSVDNRFPPSGTNIVLKIPTNVWPDITLSSPPDIVWNIETCTVLNASGPDSLYRWNKDRANNDDDLQDSGCLHVVGSLDDPFQIDGSISVEGDLYIEGYYTGQGSIYSGRNIYIVDDLIAKNPPVWTYSTNYTQADFASELASNLTNDFLGLFAAGSLFLVNGRGVSDVDEFSSSALSLAANCQPARTLATNLFNVDLFHGEPWFAGDYTKEKGYRVKTTNTLLMSLPNALPSDPGITSYDYYHNVFLRYFKHAAYRDWSTDRYSETDIDTSGNGEPRSYIEPSISRNAYFAYTRNLNFSSFENPWAWEWSRRKVYQVDALLFSEHLFGSSLNKFIINGGMVFRSIGFARNESILTNRYPNYFKLGLKYPDVKNKGSINWDRRLMEDEFNQYLPLHGFESSIHEWVELVPTNAPPP